MLKHENMLKVQNKTKFMNIRPTNPASTDSFLLNSVSEVQFLISSGIITHVCGPQNVIVSVPLYIECTLQVWKGLFFLRLYGFLDSGNILFMKVGDKLLFMLYISVASFCKFFSWGVNELSFTRSSS